MEKKNKKDSDALLEEKLRRTTNRIIRARKNLNFIEKEAAEFREIHRLLNENNVTLETGTKTSKEIQSNDSNAIPLKFPGVEVFQDSLIFSLFKEKDCSLKHFLQNEENCLAFGKTESIPTEECFRNLISCQVTEVLMPEDRNSSAVCLYVLYLLSVHPEPEFVKASFDFLKRQVFFLCPEDIFPIFINFGGKQEELFEFCEKTFLKRFRKQDGLEKVSQKETFPCYNMEMVGRILLHCTTKNFIVINTTIKSLIRGLVKITLDPRVYSGSLLPLYSSIISALCSKIQKDFKLEEIIAWVHLEDTHLLNQVELCRLLSKAFVPVLQETLVLKIICQILDLETLSLRPPIKIHHLKSILLKLKNKELPPLELFCILQLMNSSLPALTATLKDSADIKAALVSLERKINKTQDSIDLIRLKLEAAKVASLVINSTNSRFANQKL